MKDKDNKIAIIIPAYKSIFLRQTLESIAQQSSKNFHLYIGDDCSPHDVKSVVDEYIDLMNITYHRFEDNLGGVNLVSQWERCINLSSEEYVWLFSDDDLMPNDAIERLSSAISNDQNSEFFRFQLGVIDDVNNIIRCNDSFVDDSTAAIDLLCDKLSGRNSTAACEFIFSRSLYNQCDGFVNFPLAWCSDDATWYLYAKRAGYITNIAGKPILWRNADGQNISNSKDNFQAKALATSLFLEWMADNVNNMSADRKCMKALHNYIRTILNCSLERRYSFADLYKICRATGKISLSLAIKVFFSNIKFVV